MKIEIRKKGNSTAVLITFNTQVEKFESNSERIKFFKELHGWKQVVNKPSGRYEYDREGILDEIPHLDVDKSVFIIMQEHMRQMERFFKEWEDKVEFRTFPVLLNRQQIRKLEREKEVEIE